MGKATATVVVNFGNAGAAYVTGAFPSEATLKARIKNEFGDLWNGLISSAGIARAAGVPAIDWTLSGVSFDPGNASLGVPVVIGKDVFRLDDEHQAGHPIFVVLTHRIVRAGSTSASVYPLSHTLTVCTALDGSGNPSGVQRSFSSPFHDNNFSNANWSGASQGRPDQQHTLLAAKQSGFFAFKLSEHTLNSYYNFDGVFAIERFKDSQGAPDATDRGVVYTVKGGPTSTPSLCLMSLDSSLDAQEGAGLIATPDRTNLSSSGNATKVPVFPVMFGSPQIRSSRNMLAGLRDDFAANTEAMLPVPGGGAGTFRSFGKNGEGHGSGASQTRLLVRWEA